MTTQTYGPQPRWKARLHFYENRTAVKFSNEDFEKVVHEFWDEDSVLFQMPRDHLAERTLLIPSDALPYFIKYNFEHQRVVSAGELSAEDLRRVGIGHR